MSEYNRRSLARRLQSFATHLADTTSTNSHSDTRDKQYEEAVDDQRTQRRDRRELNRRHKRDPYS